MSSAKPKKPVLDENNAMGSKKGAKKQKEMGTTGSASAYINPGSNPYKRPRAVYG